VSLFFFSACDRRGPVVLCSATVLAERLVECRRLDPHPTVTVALVCRGDATTSGSGRCRYHTFATGFKRWRARRAAASPPLHAGRSRGGTRAPSAALEDLRAFGARDSGGADGRSGLFMPDLRTFFCPFYRPFLCRQSFDIDR
jgi:hypothetical protein